MINLPEVLQKVQISEMIIYCIWKKKKKKFALIWESTNEKYYF